jgi:hypothetical protein
LKILLDCKNLNISRVEFFSDTYLDTNQIFNICGNDVEIIFHSIFDTGMEALNKMMINDILIHSNSSLSTWASIISGQVAIFPGQAAVYNAELYFPNNFISFNDLPVKLEQVVSMFDLQHSSSTGPSYFLEGRIQK